MRVTSGMSSRGVTLPTFKRNCNCVIKALFNKPEKSQVEIDRPFYCMLSCLHDPESGISLRLNVCTFTSKTVGPTRGPRRRRIEEALGDSFLQRCGSPKQ